MKLPVALTSVATGRVKRPYRLLVEDNPRAFVNVHRTFCIQAREARINVNYGPEMTTSGEVLSRIDQSLQVNRNPPRLYSYLRRHPPNCTKSFPLHGRTANHTYTRRPHLFIWSNTNGRKRKALFESCRNQVKIRQNPPKYVCVAPPAPRLSPPSPPAVLCIHTISLLKATSRASFMYIPPFGFEARTDERGTSVLIRSDE